MAMSRKRKHASDQNSEAPIPGQKSITAFGKISKPQEDDGGRKMRKTKHDQGTTTGDVATALSDPSSKQNKRKRKLDVEVDADQGEQRTVKQSGGSRSKLGGNEMPSTPAHKRFKNMLPPSPQQTPSKSATALFSNLQLDAMKPLTTLAGSDTPPHTPEEASLGINEDLPEALQALSELYSAFLSALSLFYSHNGSSSPVSVGQLLPTITSHWKKCAVAFDDLRQVLAVTGTTRSEFTLRDYGRAGICLKREEPRGRQGRHAVGFVDEVELSETFDQCLRGQWAVWQTSSDGSDNSVDDFVKQLPLLEVQEDEVAKKTMSRGQQRLAYLKASQQQTAKPASSTTAATPPSLSNTPASSITGVQNRGTSLLDRVLAKQAYNSSLPAAPTKTQLERKAALHRIEDIARVLDLLAAGRPRCSFSLQAMTQQLQQSLRSPISREEVERCLDLMASEITPGFVSLLRSGTVTGVVVTKGGKVELGLLRSRVLRAVAAI